MTNVKSVDEPRAFRKSTGFLLARVGAESKRRFTRALAQGGLGISQYVLLMVLAERGAVSQRQLADAVGIDPRNLVLVLDQLQRQTLVQRAVDRDDRRVRAISLTARGRQKVRRLRRAAEQAEAELLAELRPAERRALQKLLLKLFAQVSDEA